MKISVELPSSGKNLLEELVIIHEPEGVKTMKDMCEFILNQYLGHYAAQRNMYVMRIANEMAEKEFGDSKGEDQDDQGTDIR